MARNWTAAQEAAMSTLGRTLLISAAAGSGKTATLTERIIRRLTDPEHPADLSRLLIVTFTRAAAAELRERIAGALSEAIAREPGNRHLQKQLIGLGGAHISTIDAFVREPVKAHFAELGLPATTRIADEAELAPLRERVMGELMDEFYLKYASARTGETFSLLDANLFADLCDSLTSSKNDTQLIPTCLSLYERLLSFPSELGRLEEEADRLEAMADGDFYLSDHGRVIHTWVEAFCSSAIETMEEALDAISGDPAATKAYGAPFEADLEFLQRFRQADSYAQAYELIQVYQNARLGSLRNAAPSCTAAKEARTEIVDAIKELRRAYFIDDPASICVQMKETAALCRVLYAFLCAYDARILAEKQARGITDFTDNRRYLLRLLRANNGAMAASLREQYDEVYIDEYQDVDELQDEIFRMVGGDHRFMVGDIKQSIYGFRGADPSVFAGYRQTLPALGDALDAGGASIFMSDNFRCDESVIRVTNAVCGHMFRACPHSVGYRDEDDLGFSKTKPSESYRAPAVNVTVLTKPSKSDEEDAAGERETDGGELSGVTVEATYVANCIADLLTGGATLANGRPITPGDIVILMRNRAGLSAYMQALSARGIPTGSEELDALNAGRDLLHGSDMTYLVNLLRVIDNPDADIPLSEILRAPFPGLDLEEVLAIRRVGDREAESHSLYRALEEYPDWPNAQPQTVQKVRLFIDWLENYRALCATKSAEGILRRLRRDERVAGRRTSAFLYLYEAARTYRSSTFVSLYTFLKYFEKKLETTTSVAPEKSENGGVVSIMTIHKSKGLEFPVCFIVRCGQYFSNASVTKDLIFEKNVGVAMKLYRRGSQIDANGHSHPSGKMDTTLRAAAALSTKLSEREEEMRVLYVAMTRARERLYLVGLGNEKPVHFRRGDRFATLSCNCYLRWIMGGLSAHPEALAFATVRYLSTADIREEGGRLPSALQTVISMDGDTAAGYRSILEQYRGPDQMEMMARRVPTKVPASRMHPLMLDTCVFFDTDSVPNEDGKLPISSDATWCDAQTAESIRQSLRLMNQGRTDEFELLLSENRRPTAAERGTAIHLFLQFCDHGRISPLRERPMHMDLVVHIQDECARLLQEGFLSARAIDVLDVERLAAFFESHFYKHISDAVRTERELVFSRFVPLAELTANRAFAAALGDRTLYVQGSIDLLAEFSDGHIEICDYKTDRISEAERADPSLLARRFSEMHGEQLRQYATAVREMYGRAPERVYIYSLPLGEAVEIDIR